MSRECQKSAKTGGLGWGRKSWKKCPFLPQNLAFTNFYQLSLFEGHHLEEDGHLLVTVFELAQEPYIDSRIISGWFGIRALRRPYA